MTGYYWTHRRHGPFCIVWNGANGWAIWHDDDCLGSGYPTPQHALDDLAGGHTFSASCGDTSVIGMPDEIGDWIPFRRT